MTDKEIMDGVLAEFANIAAGIVVGKMGSSTISADELKAFKL